VQRLPHARQQPPSKGQEQHAQGPPGCGILNSIINRKANTRGGMWHHARLSTMLAQPKLPTSMVLHIRRRQAERTCLIITSNNTNRQMELSERYQRAWNGRRKTGLERLQGKPSGYHCVRGGGPRRLGPSRLLRTVPSTRCIKGHICTQESRASGPNQ
jgi:hypothetical protein